MKELLTHFTNKKMIIRNNLLVLTTEAKEDQFLKKYPSPPIAIMSNANCKVSLIMSKRYVRGLTIALGTMNRISNIENLEIQIHIECLYLSILL